MGTLTFTQLQNEVRSGLGGRTDLDLRLPTAVNIAQHRLARVHDFDEMEVISTIVVGNTGADTDKYVQLPLKREVYSLVLLNGAQSLKMVQRTPQFWDRRLPLPEYWSRNWPQEYIIWGNTLEIWPLPDVSYTLRLRWSQWPPDLVNPTDVSPFWHKDELIIALALVYLYNSLGKEDDANKFSTIVKTLINEAITMDDTKPDLNILPSASDAQVLRSGQMGSVPWLDPFNKG